MDWTSDSASFGIFNGISGGKTGGSKESEGHKRQTYKEIRQDERIAQVLSFFAKNSQNRRKNEALFSVLSDFFGVGGYIIPLKISLDFDNSRNLQGVL